tara:strand:+ start:118 stop:426 length:309 start_codon:yes stop_codon:yes gene_type:complete
MEIVETVLDDIILKVCDNYDPISKCLSFMREKVHPELLALCKIYKDVDNGEYFDPDAYWMENQYNIYYIVNRDMVIRELIDRFKTPDFDTIMNNHKRLMAKL